MNKTNLHAEQKEGIPAVFLDRDGTIIEDRGDLANPSQVVFFKDTSIPSMWFQLVHALMKGEVPHNVYRIDRGSYVGQKRLEFPFLVGQIDQPSIRPLIPEIPESLNIPLLLNPWTT